MLKRVVSIVILVGFLAWVGWYVNGNREAFAPVLDVTWVDGVNMILAFLLIMTANGLFIAVVSSALGIRLVYREYMSLSLASSFANYFLPLRSGTGMRALYMNHVHGFPIIEFASTLSIMYVMFSVANGLLALIGMGLVAIKGGPANLGLAAFFALVVIAGLVVMFVDFRIGAEQERFPLKQLAQFTRAWRVLRGNRRLSVRLWSLMLLTAFATVWQCRVAFNAVSVPLPWEGVFVYAAAKNLAALIGLTPGALGIVELVSIYLGRVLGYTTADALSVQGLIRAVAIIVLIATGPFALMYLKRRLGVNS
jgi:uncharacterized membrane protein YbhN (UPF0104 family)